MSHPGDDDGEDYFLPLEDQRVFGAGIRRKRVPFVRSSEHELNTTAPATTAPSSSISSGKSIANAYLSIVLSKGDKQEEVKGMEPANTTETDDRSARLPSPHAPSASETPRCEVCDLPVSSSTQENPDESAQSSSSYSARPHEASLAHQLCLKHSHPPSHLDRKSHGLRYLSAYGWDPDSRLGLGAPGREGIREPVKGRLKADTVGLGVKIDHSAKDRVKEAKVQKLNAKQARKGHFETKKKGERLREMFYQNDDVQRYLGGGA